MGFFTCLPRWTGKYTKVKSIKSLRPADHIAVWDFSRKPLAYQHHGIVWTSGEDEDTIQVCHVWSPFSDTEEAHADSHFRISTLREFMYERSLSCLRVVEYHSSAFRELLSSWGEVHLTKADLPEVVLARCRFLMGLGKGQFHIWNQNCEHVAHWTKTGIMWCKQSLTRGGTGIDGDVPFSNEVSQGAIEALYLQIEHIKAVSIREVDRILALNDTLVYVRVNGSHFVKVNTNNNTVVALPGNPVIVGTPLRVSCYAKGYNSVRVTFRHDTSGKYLFSRSTISCLRNVLVKNKRWCRGKSGLTWELSSTGMMVSMNQHRRYLGIRGSNEEVVDVSVRGDAARFDMISVSDLTKEPVPSERASLLIRKELSLSLLEVHVARESKKGGSI